LDYFSFDVEGAEAFIASAFPFSTYAISVMTVERPKKSAVALFKKNGLEYLRTNSKFNDQTWISRSIDYHDELVARYGANQTKSPKIESCSVASAGAKSSSVDPRESMPPGWKALYIFAFDMVKGLDPLVREEYAKSDFSKLLCQESGFFVDLNDGQAEANMGKDAHVPDSIQMLESRGWEGLCIGSNPYYWKAAATGTCKIVGTLATKSTDLSLAEILRDMKAPRTIDLVVGTAAALATFPWEQYRVLVFEVAKRTATSELAFLEKHGLLPRKTNWPSAKGAAIYAGPTISREDGCAR
jgi:hypothetical protein